MLKTLHRLNTSMTLILGFSLLIFVPMTFRRLSLGVLAFVLAGLVVVCTGSFKIVFTRTTGRHAMASRLCLMADTSMAVFFAISANVYAQPIVYAAAGMLLAEAIADAVGMKAGG